MTPEARLEMLVQLGREARERTVADLTVGNTSHFETHLRERMAQAAQVWTSEVELAREPAALTLRRAAALAARGTEAGGWADDAPLIGDVLPGDVAAWLLTLAEAAERGETPP